MARSTRSSDWGFPRWRAYGAEREAVKVRLCDRHGCDEPGDTEAAKRFQAIQAAYEVLKVAEERRTWKPD